MPIVEYIDDMKCDIEPNVMPPMTIPCGHYIKDKTNQRFGKLVVMGRLPNNKYGKVSWLCKCDCGNEKIVTGECLLKDRTHGCTRSCGCMGAETQKRKSYAYRQNQPPYMALYKKLMSRCKNRKIPLDLTYDQYLEFTKINECHYCGGDILWVPHHTTKANSSAVNLDRIDSTRGYSLDNCDVCCYTCNVMKNSMPYDVFINHIRTILDRHEQRTR
jgi:hypothetical protein